MLSFIEYLNEVYSVGPGNYVALYCNQVNIPSHLLPPSGKQPGSEAHITLIYSRGTNVDHSLIRRVCDMVGQEHKLVPHRFDCFDSIPKDGERDENLATLVLKVSNPTVEAIHESLKSLGCVHSYPEFSPHITIAYQVDRDECYEYQSRLNMLIEEGYQFNPIWTTKYICKDIDEEWVKKL